MDRQVHPYYLDFSTPCFDGRHNLIMGGSWVSTGDQASVYARYWFRRHFFQHLGFRLAQTIRPISLYATAHARTARTTARACRC